MDLRDAVEQDQDSPFSQGQMKSMLHQILSAVGHTHACWYMHRDIKPSNFLVNRGQLKLCDFGLARKYHDPLLMYTQPVITLWYRPPELLFGETVYGPEVDMWRHVSSSSARTLLLSKRTLTKVFTSSPELFLLFFLNFLFHL
jgi:cell division cycle 2-like protein